MPAHSHKQRCLLASAHVPFPHVEICTATGVAGGERVNLCWCIHIFLPLVCEINSVGCVHMRVGVCPPERLQTRERSRWRNHTDHIHLPPEQVEFVCNIDRAFGV